MAILGEPVATMTAAPPVAEAAPGVPSRDALRLWARIGLQSFGGPAGQIAVMQRMLVGERRLLGAAARMGVIARLVLG
jgi:chromate transport protein ChrA